jgi:molybdopterin synthase catalytic subunit
MQNITFHEIALFQEPLDFSVMEEYVRSHSKGAHVYFSGTPRDMKDGQLVHSLFFEAYEPMALSEMKHIRDRAMEVFQLEVAVIHHRLGDCALREHAVLVGVGEPHRAAAFEACMWIMDEIKSKVPIWKKETLANGSFWVTPHP